MKVNHYTMDADSIDYDLFDSLLKHSMFSEKGTFRHIYESPECYIHGKTFISTVTRWTKPISVMFLSHEEYGGWENFNNLVPGTFGLIGFFTQPEFRGRGIAKDLFEDFDKNNRIRKLSCSPRCHGILKSVDAKDLVTVFGA